MAADAGGPKTATPEAYMVKIRKGVVARLQNAHVSATVMITDAKIAVDQAIAAFAEARALGVQAEIDAMRTILGDAQTGVTNLENSIVAIQDEIAAALAQK